MLVRVLGQVDVIDLVDREPIGLGGPTQLKLLAILVGAGRDGIAVDDLVAELWHDEELPVDPVASIRTYIARIRSAMGRDAVVTGPGRYALGADVEVDVERFESLVERARRLSGSPGVTELWAKALELWRGSAFGLYGSVPSLQAEAARLEELRAETTEAWIDARLAAGEERQLVADVDTAISRFPLREGFRAQQMTVLARAGRQADALRAFQDFRGELTEVGLVPSERLVELESEVAQGAVPRGGARRTLRGYELGERLGEGAFAVVWAGVQASVGRAVAIKQVRAELADRVEFIRHFEAEAQLVARLEHPHIVPLYDFWREPGSAYLVMRYLDGGSLSDVLVRDEPLSLDRAVAVAGQVGAALDTAHAAGVVHRDVKPANILLDAEGNAYLSDFGIAVEEAERLDPEAWLSNGSPAYAPPEQLQRLGAGPAADVYALGVTLYEVLTGRLPFAAEMTMAGLLERQLNDPIPLVRATHPEIPAAVDTVLQRATAKRAEDRYPSAGAFAADLAAAAGLDGAATTIELVDRNPYKGLRSFDEADAGDFTGRDRLVDRLLDRVDRYRTVAVVGPSGSGKSSVVRAGLLPALRQGRITGSSRWLATVMVPGRQPFDDLEAALLRVAVDPPADLASQLADDTGLGLARMVDRLIPDGRELVLVIDQFEELFTRAEEGDEAGPERVDAFLDALVTATTVERPKVRVVVTVRADFYDRPLRHDRFARLIDEATVAVHPLAADELERAITEPARGVGASFEPGLVARLTADVADQPGALPLLQYGLTELFDRRRQGVLTLAAYEELGGLSGAIAARAEEELGGCSPAEAAAVRRLFGRLVNLGEGTEDTSRRVRRSELGSDEATARVIERFGAARLLTFDRDQATREQTVEVGHEALIREWPRLRHWLDEDRDGLRIHRHLDQSALDWDQAGRPESELYRGGRLESAVEWSEGLAAAGGAVDLNPVEAAFLAASTARHEAEVEAEHQRLRRLRRLLGAVAVVAAIAVVAGVVAVVQQGRASDEAARAEAQTVLAEDSAAEAAASAVEARERADEAETANDLARARELAAASIQVLDEDPQLAIMLALAGQDLVGDDVAPPVELVTALRQAVAESRLHSFFIRPPDGPAGTITASLSPAGDRVAVGGVSTTGFEIRSADDFAELVGFSTDTLIPEGAPEGLYLLESLAWAKSGDLIVQLVAFGPGNEPGPFANDWSVLAVLEGQSFEVLATNIIDYPCVTMGDVSPDGGLVALLQAASHFECGDADGRTVVVDAATGRTVHDVTLFAGSERAQFDATATRMVIGARDGIAVIDVASGEPVLHQIDDRGRFIVSINQAGSRVAVQEFLSSRPIDIFDVDSGELVDAIRPGATLSGQQGVGNAGLSYEDDDVLVVTTDRGEIQLWDPGSGRRPQVLSSSIHQPAGFVPDLGLDRLLTAAAGTGELAVWDLETALVGLESSRQLGPRVTRSWQAVDGRIPVGAVVLDEAGNPVTYDGYLLDEATGETVAGPFVNLWRGVLIDADTLWVTAGTGTEDNPRYLALIDVETGEETPFPGLCPVVSPRPDVSEDRCAAGTEGEPLDAQMIDASPNGEHLVAFSTRGDLWFLDGETLEVQNVVEVASGADAVVAINDDGIAWTDAQPDEIFVDGATGDQRIIEGGPGGGGHCWVGEYVDADTVLCLARDGTVWLFDAATATVVDSHVVSNSLLGDFDLSPQGHLIVSGLGEITIWDMDDWTLLDSFDLGDTPVAGVHWLDDERFLAGTSDGALLTMTTNVDTLEEAAREAVVREMTEGECEQYRLTC